MGKVYRIPASFICSVSGTGNDLSQDYGRTPYRAGINGSDHYGTYAKFNGLSGIDSSKITKITLHIQRITGGTDITNNVELYYSTLSSSPDNNGTIKVRTGFPMFRDNRVSWVWTGLPTDTSPVERTVNIPLSQRAELIAYGWCIAFRDQSRYLTIGQLYLMVETSEPEFSPVRAKGSDGNLVSGFAYVKGSDGAMHGCMIYQKNSAGSMVLGR